MQHAFSAAGCGQSAATAASDDLERQKVVRMSREELLPLLASGAFREVKWTATVALALLRPEAVDASQVSH